MNVNKITIKDVITKKFLIKALLFFFIIGLIFTAGYLTGKESVSKEVVAYSVDLANQIVAKYCPAALYTPNPELQNLSIQWGVNNG